MNKFPAMIAAAAAMTFGATAASAVTLINGSFESGVAIPAGGFVTLPAGSSGITGWTVGGFGVDYVGTYWMASDGERSVDLSALSAGGVAQTFTTVVGTKYTVTFDLSGNPDGGVGQKIAVITDGGFLPLIQNYEVTAANSRTNMNWQTYSFDFTAFATTSTLTFASANFTPYGPALDNVGVVEAGGGSGSTVPEPASWALMVGGFGLVGFAARRRKTARSVAA